MKCLLDEILAAKRAEIEALTSDPSTTLTSPIRDFAAALRRPGLSVIAEIKRRSPSRGALHEDLHVDRLAAAYQSAGAAAISCLTDLLFFGALPDDLPHARRTVTVPVLRKDFVIDARQIHQSRRMGADAILLIARIMGASQLRDLLALTRELELAALVEVHDEADLERALACGSSIIGINNRDLESFEVDLNTALRLRPLIPAGVLTVAESGIARREDMVRLEQCGFDAVLLGEALVVAADPAARMRELRCARP